MREPGRADAVLAAMGFTGGYFLGEDLESRAVGPETATETMPDTLANS